MVIRGVSLLLSLAIVASGADVSSVGNWSETIDASDLIAGAGSNVTSQYESVTGSTTLDIINTAGGSWRIVARRADSTWDVNLSLFVRRTSDGSGPGAILSGTSYVQLSALDTEMFTGTGDRGTVAVRFKLTGVSKDLSPNIYSTGIIFTITAL